MTGDLPMVLSMVVDAPEIIAVRHWRERAIERQNLEAVPCQFEFADDFWPEERHDVGAH